MANLAEAACPGALWQKLPFLPDPPTPAFDPSQWTLTQYKGYAKSTVLGATAVNVAFLAVVLALFCFLLLWRLAGCLGYCCRICCGIVPGLRARKSLLSYEVMHDPWLKAHKITFCFFAFGCIGLAITGLSTLPKPIELVSDLAIRLDGASAFATSLLDASDGMVTSASALRPVVTQAVAMLQEEMGGTQSITGDIQCTGSFLDSGLSGSGSPAALQPQLAAVMTAMQSSVAPAIAAVVVLLNTTYGIAGVTPALAAVAAMPSALTTIRNALASYGAALAGLPSSRLPLSASDPAVAALQTAQAGVDLTRWINNVQSMYDSIVTITNAAQQGPYNALATSMRTQRAAATNVTQILSPLTSAVSTLDTLYLGTSQQLQQQPQGSTYAGRACLGRLSQRLASFDSDVFRFNSPPERSAIDTANILHTDMEALYGVNSTSAAAVNWVMNTTTTNTTNTSVVLPSPLASGLTQLGQLLTPMATVDADAVGAQCSAVQSVLTRNDGSSALPDASQTLSYLTSLRTALTSLLQPVAAVTSALTSYSASASDSSYNALYNAVNAARSPVIATSNIASAPSPTGSPELVAAATNASAAATSSNLTGAVRAVNTSMIATTAWLKGSNGNSSSFSAAALNRTVASVSQLQTVLTAVMQQSQQAAATSAAAANTSSTSPVTLSTFMQPLQQSLQLIAATISNGVTAVGEQLDNAMGKVVQSPSPPPAAPSSHRRRLHQVPEPDGGVVIARYQGNATLQPPADLGINTAVTSASPSPSSTASTNATTVVRQELVTRIDDVAAFLRRDSVATDAKVAYWVAVGIYGAVILFCLLLGVAIMLNFPAGTVAMLIVHLVLTFVLLAGAWAMAAGSVVAHDACGNADGVVLGAVSPRSPLFPLLRYYLQGVGGSLASVLRATGLGDTTRLQAAADILNYEVLNPLLLPAPPPTSNTTNTTSSYASFTVTPWPGSLGSVQYVLGGVLVDLGAVANSVTSNLTVLLAMGDRNTVVAQYGAVTSWACCLLGGHLLTAWVCATACGLLGWLAAMSALMVLKNLDDMPVSRRCGCLCYNPNDYPKPSPRRRRGGDAQGGRNLSSSGGGAPGGVAGAIGAAAGAMMYPKTVYPQVQEPTKSQAYAMGVSSRAYDNMAPPPPVASPYYFGSHGGASTGGSSTFSGSTSAGGAPPSNTHWPTGQRKSPTYPSASREVVEECGLFNGAPVKASAQLALRTGPPASVAPGRTSPTAGGSSGPAVGGGGGAARSSVTVCVMDSPTAASFGFGTGLDGDLASGQAARTSSQYPTIYPTSWARPPSPSSAPPMPEK